MQMIVLVRHNTHITICKVFIFVVVAKSSAKLSLLRATLGNCCLTKGSGLMNRLAPETNGQHQVLTVYAKIGHMLGKLFFQFLMHMGSFTPIAPTWKVLNQLI